MRYSRTLKKGSFALALILTGVLLSSTLLTPAVAHIGKINHLWQQHIRPRTDARYYTKAQSDERYAVPSMWAQVGETGTIVSQSGDITISRAAAGSYFVTLPTTAADKPINATVSGLNGDVSGEISVTLCGGAPQGVTCTQSDNQSTIWLRITGGLGASTDMAFFLRVG